MSTEGSDKTQRDPAGVYPTNLGRPHAADRWETIAADLETAGFVDVHEVGHGGFGVVYRCTQQSLDRTVAVKVLSAELDTENTARFVREQHAMGQLTGHPHIVNVLYTGTTVHGNPYLVMPFCSQDSLESRLRREGPLSIGDALRLGVKIAGALETAHRRGIMHRDIKPANILFTDYGEPALTDFGISRMPGAFETTAGIIAGTPAYAAPEILAGATAAVAADIYSLGATLFSAVTGHAAFERRGGEQLIAQFLRITGNAVPDLRDTGIPDDLCTVIEQAMAADPRARPASAAEVGDRLRRVQAAHRLPVDHMFIHPSRGVRPPHSPAGQPEPSPEAADRAVATVPPSAPVKALPHDLTSFVGRRTELAQARKLITRTRLVTLTGIGGVGKTRLALRIAHDMQRTFSGAVWLVQLADLRHGPLLADVVAASLGLRDDRARSPQALLADFLAPRTALLVLDNCEQIVQPVAELVEELLKACPELHILATSREVLGIGVETVLAVPPLSAPPPAADLPRGGLPQYDAVTLFSERAAAAVPNFVVTDANQESVARICHQLDGLPLAIELAAARLRAMSIDQILTRLADRFALLTVGTRTAPTRQQTLRCCVDWSYALCTLEEQKVWAQLSVFAGSFGLDAAESVNGAGTSEISAEVIAGLVDKSILLREVHGTEVRFRMLETLRDYGRAKLRDAGEHGPVRRRYRDWYRELALTAREQWISPHQLDWIARLSLEQPNLREAMESCLSAPDETNPAAALQLATALYPFWLARGYYSEGRRWLERALAGAPEQAAITAAQAIYASSALADLQGDLPAAGAWLVRGRELVARAHDAESSGYIAQADGVLAFFTGDLDRACTMLEQALGLFRRSGDLTAQVDTQIKLGLILEFRGFGTQAVDCYNELLDITDSHGESVYRSFALWSLGIAVWRQGNSEHATALLKDSLRLARQIDDPIGAATCLEALSWVAAERDDTERVGKLMGAAEILGRSTGVSSVLLPDLQVHHDESARRIRERDAGRFEIALETGRRMNVDAATAYGLGESEQARPKAGAPAALTRREQQVADLIARGLTNRSIARELVVSPRTVHGHVEHILSKLGFTSRVQVAAWVAEHRHASSSHSSQDGSSSS